MNPIGNGISKSAVGGDGNILKDAKSKKIEVTETEGATTGIGPKKNKSVSGDGCVVGSGNCP